MAKTFLSEDLKKIMLIQSASDEQERIMATFDIALKSSHQKSVLNLIKGKKLHGCSDFESHFRGSSKIINQ